MGYREMCRELYREPRVPMCLLSHTLGLPSSHTYSTVELENSEKEND